VAVRDYHIIRVGLSTGLGVQEIADLKCRDFHLVNRISCLFVRHGKSENMEKALERWYC
jgi:site-specific recombinase XerD